MCVIGARVISSNDRGNKDSITESFSSGLQILSLPFERIHVKMIDRIMVFPLATKEEKQGVSYDYQL